MKRKQDQEELQPIVPRFLRVKEAARYLGFTEGTLRVLTCQKRIPHIKKGRAVRYDRLELERWMLQDKVKVASVWQT